jgi:tRNA (guanine-N7-)-methyltransferase
VTTKKTLKEFANIALSATEIEGKIDFAGIFGRKAAVHIEVGSGKGTFLVNQATALPDVNFLGIEWANKYYKFAVDRIGRRGLGNVRVIRTEAALFIAENVGDETVDCFHIYFPDPWPKKRHHKRRFISTANVEQFYRCLKPAGVVNIATDHQEYFEWMGEVFAGFKDKFEKVDFIKPAGATEDECAGTNFERKYLKENRAIYTTAFRKILNPNIEILNKS